MFVADKHSAICQPPVAPDLDLSRICAKDQLVNKPLVDVPAIDLKDVLPRSRPAANLILNLVPERSGSFDLFLNVHIFIIAF